MAQALNQDWQNAFSNRCAMRLQQQELAGEPAVLLTSGILRSVMARFVKYTIPGLRVLSYQEIPDDKQVRIVSVVGQAG